MEDRLVLLLQRVIDENLRLREAIEARDNEQKRVLEELSAKFESNSTSTPARTTGRTMVQDYGTVSRINKFSSSSC